MQGGKISYNLPSRNKGIWTAAYAMTLDKDRISQMRCLVNVRKDLRGNPTGDGRVFVISMKDRLEEPLNTNMAEEVLRVFTERSWPDFASWCSFKEKYIICFAPASPDGLDCTCCGFALNRQCIHPLVAALASNTSQFPGLKNYTDELNGKFPEAMNTFNLKSSKNPRAAAAAAAAATEALDVELVDTTSEKFSWAAFPPYFGSFLAPTSTTAPVRRPKRIREPTELERIGAKQAEKAAKKLKLGPGCANVINGVVQASLIAYEQSQIVQHGRRRQSASRTNGGGRGQGGKKKNNDDTMTSALVHSGREMPLGLSNASIPTSPVPTRQHEVGQPMPYDSLLRRRAKAVKPFFSRDDINCAKPRVCDCGKPAPRTIVGDAMPHVCIDCGTGMCANHGYAAPADDIITDNPPGATSSSSVAPYEPALADRLCQNCATEGWVVHSVTSSPGKTTAKKRKSS